MQTIAKYVRRHPFCVQPLLEPVVSISSGRKLGMANTLIIDIICPGHSITSSMRHEHESLKLVFSDLCGSLLPRLPELLLGS